MTYGFFVYARDMKMAENLEILAPVNAGTLDAALRAGADAVYFGLTKLNARRGAKNFAPEELAGVVEKIHAAEARAHLTLNIDLAQRELGLAVRTLELARRAKVDAVIVKDFAIVSLISEFPELEFHCSTQMGISSREGVMACREFGFKRVVLAREMTLEEIRACGEVEGIELEAFGQGAMCFSCSGRCLMSSWVGGRSGNRGMCASPCRVNWNHDDGEGECESLRSPFSMHDLCLASRLRELKEAGVASIKIEGRLKSAQWVADAVSLYRDAQTGQSGEASGVAERAAGLGNYTGRQVGVAYFDGNRDDLTGESGRRAAGSSFSQNFCSGSGEENAGLGLTLSADEKGGIVIDMTYGHCSEPTRIPPQRIANAKRAMTIGRIMAEVDEQLPRTLERRIEFGEGIEERLLPRRFSSTVISAVNDFVRRMQKESDGTVRISLPETLENRLAMAASEKSGSANRLALGSQPTRMRISLEQLGLVLERGGELPVMVEILPGDGEVQMEKIRKAGDRVVGLAFPQVTYQGQLPWLSSMMDFAKSEGIIVEINSWDAWQVARTAGVKMEAGQGLAVLNSMAGDFLKRCGFRSVAVSCEADREQLEDLCRTCDVPLNLTVFSHPVLMQTRAKIPLGKYTDARKYSVVAVAAGDQLTYLRATTPYDWRGISNSAVKVAVLTLDMAGTKDLRLPPMKEAFLFNYDRTLR